MCCCNDSEQIKTLPDPGSMKWTRFSSTHRYTIRLVVPAASAAASGESIVTS
jgi:hypothetical protein